MYIANPIYDIIFKYMMKDNRVARLLIGTIIDEEIILLEPRPHEEELEIEKKSHTRWSLYRLDYTATIKTKDGERKKIIIEIQKAKLHTDIMRFRQYLATQYASPQNVYSVAEGTIEYQRAMPIVSIYFLGHRLEHIKAPVIKVAREYIDVVKQEKIKEKEEFIESLTHDSYVIQIPYLCEKRKNELLTLLSIFDQSNRTEDYHILNVNKKDFPEKYRIIIRRLQKAIAEPSMKSKMKGEDELIEAFAQDERLIASLVAAKERIILEKDKALAEKDKALLNAAQTMLKSGMDIKIIIQITGLKIEEIKTAANK